jgi:peptidyl-tRNA hydrolase, PTH1 family
MKLLVGLGNPGRKYEHTRHNAGFWFVERLAARTGTVLRNDARFQALVGRHGPAGAWLLMPQGFMNLSGVPVQLLASFFRITPAEILVVHDELDFAPGVARLKQGGGVAGHNGLKDISARLGTHDYWRLRIGIGHPGDKDVVADYVLHRPDAEDQAAIDNAIARALDVVPLVLSGDVQQAMLKLHTQEKKTETAPSEPKQKEPGNDTRPAEGTQAKRDIAPQAARQPDAGTESPFKALLKKFTPDKQEK